MPYLQDIDADLHMPLEQNFQYYSTNKFHDNNSINDCLSAKSFSVLNCNIRSFSANFDALARMLSELYFPFSIIGLTEVKIKENEMPAINTDIPSYHFISQPSNSNAGGVGFYINNNLKTKIRTDLSSRTDEYEALWIEIINNSKRNLVCGVIYRHPRCDLEIFMNYIDMAIEEIHQKNKYSPMQGDCNLDLLKSESHQETKNFLNALNSLFFQPQILQPTRITDHSATLVHNIFFNSLDHFTISGNLIYDISDHLPNFIIITKYTALPYSESNLINNLNLINWDRGDIWYRKNPDKLFDSFYDKISEIVDLYVPVIQLSKKEMKTKSKPWITPGIQISISKMNKLYKNYLKTKSVHYYTRFKIYRNKINHLLRISKRNYYNSYFSIKQGNSKLIWKEIKSIINVKSKVLGTPTVINKNESEISDPKKIADAFNRYFSNVKETLDNKIPRVSKSPHEYMTSSHVTAFFFILHLY